VNQVYIIPVKGQPMAGASIIGGVSRAVVLCYAQAIDYEEAVKMCLSSLRDDGVYVNEILDSIFSMNVSEWSLHVMDQWPQQVSQLPSQAEFEAAMRNNEVIYGPFGVYE